MKAWINTVCASSIALLASTITGCFYTIENECQVVMRQGSETRGNLVGVESEMSAAELPDYPRKMSITTNGVKREVSAMGDDFVHGQNEISVGLGIVTLSFQKPTEQGITSLAVLGGRVCERTLGSGQVCRAVEGDVDVAAIAEPCGDGACGSIDIKIHIPPPTPVPRDAVVHGDARLLAREWKEDACKQVHEGSHSAFAVEL